MPLESRSQPLLVRITVQGKCAGCEERGCMHGDGICRSVSGKRCPVCTGRSSLPSVYDGRGLIQVGVDMMHFLLPSYFMYVVIGILSVRRGAGRVLVPMQHMWRCMFDPYYMDVRCLPDSFRNQHDHAGVIRFRGELPLFCLLFIIL